MSSTKLLVSGLCFALSLFLKRLDVSPCSAFKDSCSAFKLCFTCSCSYCMSFIFSARAFSISFSSSVSVPFLVDMAECHVWPCQIQEFLVFSTKVKDELSTSLVDTTGYPRRFPWKSSSTIIPLLTPVVIGFLLLSILSRECFSLSSPINVASLSNNIPNFKFHSRNFEI